MRPCGHGARLASTIGTSTSTAPRQRRIRKLSGGAYGSPYLAAMKPVLQRKTKNGGIGESQPVCGVAVGVAEVSDVMVLASLTCCSGAGRRPAFLHAVVSAQTNVHANDCIY
jgi:hypothetical protein